MIIFLFTIPGLDTEEKTVNKLTTTTENKRAKRSTTKHPITPDNTAPVQLTDYGTKLLIGSLPFASLCVFPHPNVVSWRWSILLRVRLKSEI